MTPDEDALSALIRDAYYAARDNGGTMHSAADDARRAIVAAGWTPPVPVAAHTITWTLDEGRITHPRVTCSEGPEAQCRLDSMCGCESIGPIEDDEDGWFHTVTVFWESSSGHGEREDKHRMNPGGPCNIAAWIENSDEVELDMLAPVDVVIPFEPVWAVDFYQWRPLVAKVGP